MRDSCIACVIGTSSVCVVGAVAPVRRLAAPIVGLLIRGGGGHLSAIYRPAQGYAVAVLPSSPAASPERPLVTWRRATGGVRPRRAERLELRLDDADVTRRARRAAEPA